MPKFGPVTPFSQDLHKSKYRLEGETFEDFTKRFSSAVADSDFHYNSLVDIIGNQRFMPAGRAQLAIGNSSKITAMNCLFGSKIPDSMEGIMEELKNGAMTLRMGGGCGWDFSTLRPSGSPINGLGGVPASGPVSFMNLWNIMCSTIMSQGLRRGAMIAVLRVDHPDIIKFIHAKRDETSLKNFNISVAITDEFMKALENNDSYDLKFNDNIYKRISAQEVWDAIMENNWDLAEPGVLFIDQINKMHPLSYVDDISGVNPCLAEGTLVHTPSGLKPVEKVNVGDKISTIRGVGIVDNVEMHKDMPVYMVETSDGSKIKATSSHIFHVLHKNSNSRIFDKNTTLDSLEPGDKIRVYPGIVPNNKIGRDYLTNLSDKEFGFLVGCILGDGCYTQNSKTLKISSNKEDEQWNNILINILKKAGSNSVGINADKKTLSCSLCAYGLIKELDKTPLTRGYSHEKFLPLELLNTNIDFISGYLDGLICTDGTVTKNSTVPMVRIISTSYRSLEMAKRALSMLGIHARIYVDHSKAAGNHNKILGRKVTRKHQSYTLLFMGSNLKTFHRIVKLTHPEKREKLQDIIDNFSVSGELWYTTIKRITQLDDKYTVYDLHEPESDTWITDGLVNRGCGEVPLEYNGGCLLGSFNLVKYVNVNKLFDFEQFVIDIEHTVRAMDNIIDVSILPLEAQAKTIKARRRIGIGVTGVANALELLGYPYASDGFIKEQEKILEVLRDTVYLASADLAKEKGSFDLFDFEEWSQTGFVKTLPEYVVNRIKEQGLRNALLLSIAPTGTISLCADNISSGIEPPFMMEGMRKIRVIENGEEAKKEFLLQDWLYSTHGIGSKTADQISADDHIRVLCSAQKYIDSAISKTCNIGDDVTFEEFKDIYLKAWRGGAKGCTTFRPSGKRFGIMQPKKEEGAACFIDPETGVKTCST
jgi:ribonucleoside-diphosphate reductase alpha chain